MVHGWPEMEIEAPWKKHEKASNHLKPIFLPTKPILLCHKNRVSRHHHLNPSILPMLLPPYKNQTQDLHKQMFIEENGQCETHCFFCPARIYKTTPALNPNVHPATGGLMNLHLKPKSMEHLTKNHRKNSRNNILSSSLSSKFRKIPISQFHCQPTSQV